MEASIVIGLVGCVFETELRIEVVFLFEARLGEWMILLPRFFMF